eukprot:TRINITY_DN4955_c0_g1_i10.p1 TRINITY_DN4955_c0_g1~~TRINITY_DN4955_c0_g1_i10.p1  ORF type:complete len:302 (+),score=110.43 TRINITY_DN4955_c0_g1_i10:653-1558(+)
MALADCSGAFSQKLGASAHKVEDMDLEYEIVWKNPDGSHFSVDENGFIVPYFALIALLAGFLVFNARKFLESNRKNETVDWAFALLLSAIACQFLSLVLTVTHLVSFAEDGLGLPFFKGLGQALGVLSQFLITLLLILISRGWTIAFMKFESSDKVTPIALSIATLQVFLVGLGNLEDEIHSRYHEWESGIGYGLLAIRIALCVYFLVGVDRNMMSSNGRMKDFLVNFAFIGAIYLMAFPALMFASVFCAPYVRHRVITIGTIAMQSFGMLVFTFFFTNKRGVYYSLSFRGSTILPSDKIC